MQPKIVTWHIPLILGILLLGSELTWAKDKTPTSQPDVAEESQKSTEQLKSQLARTIKSVNSQAARIEQLGQVTASQDSQLLEISRAVMEINLTVQLLAKEIDQMNRRLEFQERRAAYSDSINYDILAQLISLESRIISLSASISETNQLDPRLPTVEPSTRARAKSSYNDRYLQALSRYQNHDYRTAVALFRELIAENDQHELADNAQYWIGECFYALKQYDQAIIEFGKVAAFPLSNKDDDAQYKIALCYLASGAAVQARRELQKLIDRFPNSEYINNVKQLMQTTHD